MGVGEQLERIPLGGSLVGLDLGDWPGRIFGIAFGYALWWFVASISPSSLVPYPMATFETAWELVIAGDGLFHLFATLKRTVIAFVLAVILGTVIGVVMGLSDFWGEFGPSYVLIGISIPGVAWAAITVLVFGFSILAPVTAVTLTAYPYVAINVWKGVENIDADLVEMAKAFDVPLRDQLRHSVLLDIAPELFVAVRYGLAISWKVVNTAEFIAASDGIGYKVIQKYQVLDVVTVFAYVTLFMVFVLGVELLILRPLEKKVYEYRPEADIEVVA